MGEAGRVACGALRLTVADDFVGWGKTGWARDVTPTQGGVEGTLSPLKFSNVGAWRLPLPVTWRLSIEGCSVEVAGAAGGAGQVVTRGEH